jgi:hypothetical protein
LDERVVKKEIPAIHQKTRFIACRGGPTFLSDNSLPLSKSNLFFKLEEEEKPALLLLLPKVFAETAVLDSAL